MVRQSLSAEEHRLNYIAFAVEKERIRVAGGYVEYGRVNGSFTCKFLSHLMLN